MVGSNEIRAPLYWRIDIKLFGNNNAIIGGIIVDAANVAFGWSIHSYSQPVISIVSIRHSAFVLLPCSHVISLLSRIYFLNRSVLQFALSAENAHTMPSRVRGCVQRTSFIIHTSNRISFGSTFDFFRSFASASPRENSQPDAIVNGI